MRLITSLAIAAASVAIGATALAPAAEAQARKKRGETVIVVKQRSFLDAGTQALPGRYENYSRGLTPFRPGDSIVPTGSVQGRLLPGPFGPFHY